MYLLIHTHGHIEVSHYAFRSFENTAEGIGMVLWNLQSEDLASGGGCHLGNMLTLDWQNDRLKLSLITNS